MKNKYVEKIRNIENPFILIFNGIILYPIILIIIGLFIELPIYIILSIPKSARTTFWFYAYDLIKTDIVRLSVILFLLKYYDINILPKKLNLKVLSTSFFLILIGIVLWYISKVILQFSENILPMNWPAGSFEDKFKNYQMLPYTIIITTIISTITPLSKEIFFRGLCYKVVRKKYNIKISILISTILMIIFHPVLAWIPHLILLNIIICLVYERTKVLGSVVLLSSVYNLCEALNEYFFRLVT